MTDRADWDDRADRADMADMVDMADMAIRDDSTAVQSGRRKNRNPGSATEPEEFFLIDSICFVCFTFTFSFLQMTFF